MFLFSIYILGPIVFSFIHVTDWGCHQKVIRRQGVRFHSYADDIVVSSDDLVHINTFLNCILNIKSWMAENVLQPTQDKTEVSIICPEDERDNFTQTQTF